MTQSLTKQSEVSPADRQRQREARAQRPARTGDRLPTPPRQRRPLMAALAVVLILGGAAVAGLLALRLDSRVPVLVARQDIPVGKQITRDDLAVARIASSGIADIPAGQAGSVVGKYAGQTIKRSQLLDASMVDAQGFLKPGTVAVGVPMKPGRVPVSGLEPGDVVTVMAVPQQGAAHAIASQVVVSSTTQTAKSGGAFSSSGTAGQDPDATLIVNAAQAPEVAQFAAQDAIALLLVQRGATTTAGTGG